MTRIRNSHTPRRARSLLVVIVGIVVIVGLVAFNPGDPPAAAANVGSITEYGLPTSSVPRGIVAGPDGNVWFTDRSGTIGRITLAGSVTRFTVPTAGSSPEGIVAGPDGNMWFTELYGNKIGRVSTTGTFSEFTVPTANSEPAGIAVVRTETCGSPS